MLGGLGGPALGRGRASTTCSSSSSSSSSSSRLLCIPRHRNRSSSIATSALARGCYGGSLQQHQAAGSGAVSSSSSGGGGSGSSAARRSAPPAPSLLLRRQLPWHRHHHTRLARAVTAAASAGGDDAAAAAAAATAAGEAAAAAGPGPMTEEQLRALGQRQQEEQEAALAEAWREQYDGDVRSLYGYVERDQEMYMDKVEMALDVPKAMRERQGALLGLDGLPAGMASDMVGMGSWRLRNSVDESIGFMIGRLEGLLREMLEDDLTLYPPEQWKDRGWDFVDSIDPKREWDGWSFADIPNPAKGEEGYPRLLLENRVYCSRVFRKLHLEVAVRQDGLQALHVVLFPRYDYDLPILAMDMVIAGGAITLAVVDACPLSSNLSLPRHYLQTMHELQTEFLGEFATNREVPEWGKAIFSPLAVCMRPTGVESVASFIKYCIALTRAHLMYSTLLSPVEPRTKTGARRLAELAAGHQRFVTNQLANQKTSRVIESALGPEMCKAYMEELVFDFNPTDSPPWYDGSLSRLYRHFDRHPEPWKDGEQLLAIRQKLDVDKSRMFLERFLAGESSIAGERLQFALATMYDADEEFRTAINESIPDLPLLRLTGSAEIGARLEEEFLQLMAAAKQQQAPERQQPQKPQPKQQQQQQSGDAGAQKADKPL